MKSSTVPFAGCLAENNPEDMHLCLQGLPCDSRSSYRKGAAAAPSVIRDAFNEDCYNAVSDSGVDLTGMVADWGDLSPGNSWEETMRAYARRGRELFAAGRTPFFLGGDHAVTIPVALALETIDEPVHVVQLDAHPDLYPTFKGGLFSHACTGARILEMPHVASLTILGVRTMNQIQEREVEHWGEKLRIFEARNLTGRLPFPEHLTADSPVYVTLDLDVFEPAFAPGVAHPVPGGLSPRQVLDFFAAAPFRLVGMDAVEVNPSLDVNHQTAVLAGRLVQQAMALAHQGLKRRNL